MKNSDEKDVPIWHKMNLTIEEAAAFSNIGEKIIREEANRQGCRFVIKIGKKKLLIKRREFEEWNKTRMFL